MTSTPGPTRKPRPARLDERQRPDPRAVNGRANREIRDALATPGDNQYHPCPEAFVAEGVARGQVKAFRAWAQSRVYPGTERDLWIYTPAGFDAGAAPPALMVFNDGGGYLNREGPVRAAAVFDTLTAAGEMPPTVGVFVMPGRKEGSPQQRSLEYDSVTDAYVRFLTEDVLPFVEGEIGCALTTDPEWRTICGISSGGICAFTAAWYRPDAFGRVLSHCGSFTAIRGGHNYPYLIRSTNAAQTDPGLDAERLRPTPTSCSGQLAAGQQGGGGRGARSSRATRCKFVFGEGGYSLRPRRRGVRRFPALALGAENLTRRRR